MNSVEKQKTKCCSGFNDFAGVRRLGVQLAIFDLDGCLFDDGWRLPLIKPEGYANRYDEYHSELVNDVPLPRGESVLNKTIQRRVDIIFITARPTTVMAITKNKIEKEFTKLNRYALFMRAPGEEGICSVELKRAITKKIIDNLGIPQKIILSHDDRLDVAKMYAEFPGIRSYQLTWNSLKFVGGNNFPCEPQNAPSNAFPVQKSHLPSRITAAEILEQAGKTYRERNAVYGDNYLIVGKIMEILHGQGAPNPAATLVGTADQFNVWHLYELLIVKLTRFANSGLTHQDSIRDLAVYAAMIEGLIAEKGEKIEA